MGKVIEVDFNSERCIFCGRAANRLCDIVIGQRRYAGHPPKINGKVSNEPMSEPITCDNIICDKCSIKLNEYMDICPKCFEEIKLKGRIKR